MPEAAVDKHGQANAGEHDVCPPPREAGQRHVSDPKAPPAPMQFASERQLGQRSSSRLTSHTSADRATARNGGLHHPIVTSRRHDPSMDARWMRMGEIVRYASQPDRLAVEVDGYANFHYLTDAPGRGDARLQLEAGINTPARVQGPDGARRPVIAIRSSPWKAGQGTNPWHDEFDLDHGHVRYFGDHKPNTIGLPGATRGNRARSKPGNSIREPTEISESWRLP